MPEELDKTAISKVTRDVIYRQRVFGTSCGKGDFIKVDDTRKLSRLGLVIYIVFIAFTLQFTFDRIRIGDAFSVNTAITHSLTHAPFKQEPEPKYWNDLTTTDDLQAWLVSAFPTVITPAVKSFIYPLSYVRFTVRRIQSMDNPDPRFQALAPVVWLEKIGVPPSSTSDESDDKEPFGQWRVWGSNLRDVTDPEGPINRTVNGITREVNGLAWCSKPQARCPADAELLDVLHVPPSVTGADVVNTCREWCSDMPRCRCFTQRLDSDTCEFFYTERFYPVNGTAADSGEADYASITCDGVNLRGRILDEPSTLLPYVQYENPQGRDFVAHYPWMRRFSHQSNEKGWRNTPGFVFKLKYWSQDDVSGYLEELRQSPDSGLGTMPTQVNIVANQLREWVDGGIFTWGTSSITLDFVTYNPHYEIYSHVTLVFRLEASGLITKSIGLTSLNINQHGPVSSDPMEDFQDFTSIVYLLFVALYILGELWELGSKWEKYFTFAWNWLTIVQLVLHVAVIVWRYFYLQDDEFAEQMASPNLKNKDITATFSRKALTYEYFVWVSALNLLFVFFQLLHYLNDSFPRVRVLVDTMVRAMTPIIFLVIVIADAFFGFVFWATLMYGKSVSSFSNMGAAATACTELLFGQVDAYFELRETYPLSGSLFFILYMMIFYFVLQNVSKAVVLVSYDDACNGYEGIMLKEQERKRARMSSHSDGFTRYWKLFQKKAVVWIAGDRKKGHHSKALKKFQTSSIQVILFAGFCICYTVMAYWMAQVSWSNQLSASLRTAISVPVFEKIHPATGEVSRDNTFDTITTPDDVRAWISQVLPRVMFNSSAGTLDREANPLKVYASALPQLELPVLVVNDWNIMLGQAPVRVTTRYFAEREDFSIGSFRIPRQVRSQIEEHGRTFVPAGSFTERPSNPKTLAVLDRYCNHTAAYGSTDANATGFSCMLGVDYGATLEALASFADGDFIMEQTAIVAVDFVVYNGYADAFVYVAITFEFQPNGMIYTGLITQTVRLSQYAGNLVFRIILEVLVTIFSLFYIRLSFIGMFRAVKADIAQDKQFHDSKAKSLWHLVISVRAIFRFLVLHPFNLLDFLSSIATVYTMAMWFTLTSSPLSSKYFFPPSPIWDPASCATPWCSDDDVINHFYREGKQIEAFTQVCAVNTVMVFFRLLKYLQGFPSMAIMFKTFGRAAKDLAWFILMMLVLLLGYVCLGFHLFGMRSPGFQSIGTSLVACFEMFLGTFRYRELRDSDPLAYFFFSITYIILFKYMIINMFFAIVDKHYHREILSDAYKSLEADKVPMGERISESIKAFIKGVKMKDLMISGRTMSSVLSSVGGPQSPGQSPRHSEFSEPSLLSPMSSGARLASPSMAALSMPSIRSVEAGKAAGAGEVLPKPDISSSQSCRNWHSLPPDAQKWAQEESYRINSFVADQREKRSEIESVKDELDAIHVQAEQELQQKSKEARQDAEMKLDGLRKQELLRLKEIHQDQESLAWYIMKREAELKNLEAIKKAKQERFDKMVKAATSLITSGEDEGEAIQEQ
mmetsp:Transcript_73381/g.215190  ORF Transcript_73381/g.215190 Transcript_73381/m.215190 type:complete len:1538 (+) Transcript_73381:116-4729(+)